MTCEILISARLEQLKHLRGGLPAGITDFPELAIEDAFYIEMNDVRTGLGRHATST